MTKSGDGAKPDGAWTAEQVGRLQRVSFECDDVHVAEFLVKSVDKGDFYILCPDNTVDRKTDELRMEWTINDIIQVTSSFHS